MIKVDAIVELRFKTTEEGGRQEAMVLSERQDGYPLRVDDEACYCQFLTLGQMLHLGKTYQLPIQFLNSRRVLPKLFPGKAVSLWEEKEIATGTILQVS